MDLFQYSLLPLWEEFMEKVNKKAVTKDLWNQMFEFATTVKTDFSDYDEVGNFIPHIRLSLFPSP